MNNLVSVKNIVNNQSFVSEQPLLGLRQGGPQGGASGFDDIFSEVKKSLSGQLDAASSGNSLPSGALCVIPLSPNINVLTQKNSEFSEDTIRQFALGEGLNADMLRLIMGGTGPIAPLESKGMVAALSVGNAALRAGLEPAAVDAPQALNQDMARLLMKGAGLGHLGKPDVAPGAWVGLGVSERGAEDGVVKAADLPGLTMTLAVAAGAQGAVPGGVALPATAMPVLAGSPTQTENARATSMSAVQTPIQVPMQVLAASVGVAAAVQEALNPLVGPTPEAALEHLSVSYAPAPTTVPASAATAMDVLAGSAMVTENDQAASPPVVQTPTQAPVRVPMDSVGVAVQVALASQQGVSAKMAENTVITQALGEVALKTGLTERKMLAGLSAERGADPHRDAFVATSAGEVLQTMPGGAIWHEEIDLSQFVAPHAGGRDIASASNGMNSDIKGSAITTENAALQDKLYQQQQYQKLSEQLMDVTGRRISEQVAKGVWQMSFQLRPTRLGLIEVRLGMSDGAIDATLSASQAGTQQLLDGGLERLKDALEGAGVSVGRLATDAHGARGDAQQRSPSGEPGSRSTGLASTPVSAPVALKGGPESRVSAAGVDLFV